MLALTDSALARLAITAAQRRARLPPRSFPIRAVEGCPRGLERSGDAGYPKGTTKHYYYSMPHPRHRRHGPHPTRIAPSCPDGCTESLLLANGVEQMVELVRGGLATANAERVVARRGRSRTCGSLTRGGELARHDANVRRMYHTPSSTDSTDRILGRS